MGNMNNIDDHSTVVDIIVTVSRDDDIPFVCGGDKTGMRRRQSLAWFSEWIRGEYLPRQSDSLVKSKDRNMLRVHIEHRPRCGAKFRVAQTCLDQDAGGRGL